MAPASRKKARVAGGEGEDRLSDLPDGVLGHILSFLPTKEAGRAAVLARRWRHMFANVHTISFEEEEIPEPDPWDSYSDDELGEERESKNGRFLRAVNAALLCRRRCGGPAPNASLRAFRVALADFHDWDGAMVAQWLHHVARQGDRAELLRLDLRLRVGRTCRRDHWRYKRGMGFREEGSDSDTEEEARRWPEVSFRLPRLFFSCAALRSLRVAFCRLKPPASIFLPNLETLHLTGVRESGRTIHRLISSCGSLADLTLEACAKLRRVSLRHDRLRRFSLRCCHGAVSVELHAPELRALDYRGTVPAESLITLHHSSPTIASLAVDLCGPTLSEKEELVGLRTFLDRFVGVRHLHLQSCRLGCSIESELFNGFPSFLHLRQLELTGCLTSCSAVDAVTRILKGTPNLEVLSLFLMPGENDPVAMTALNPEVSIECLRRQLRKITMVHYQGNEAQRILANLLLCNALVLDDLRVVFPKAPLAVQAKLMNEMKEWAVNKSARMTFM